MDSVLRSTSRLIGRARKICDSFHWSCSQFLVTHCRLSVELLLLPQCRNKVLKGYCLYIAPAINGPNSGIISLVFPQCLCSNLLSFLFSVLFAFTIHTLSLLRILAILALLLAARGAHSSRLAMGNLQLLQQSPITDLLIEELVDIQTDHLGLLAHAQVHAGDELDNVQQDAAHDERIARNGTDLSELQADLPAIAVHGAGRLGAEAVQRRDPGLGEDAGEEGADHAADAVQLEDVHALVDAQPLLDVLHARARGAGEEANHGGDPERHEARRGRDADEPRDGARARADDGELALVLDVVDGDPAQHAERGRRVGVEAHEHGAHRRVERGAAVEAEPAEPDEDGACGGWHVSE